MEYTIGVPCKYAPIALMPSYIVAFGSEFILKCRGGECVRFEVEEKLSYTDDFKRLEEISLELYGISMRQLNELWRRRMITNYGQEWSKVKMIKIDD